MFKTIRRKPGVTTVALFTLSGLGYTIMNGPDVESKYLRYAIAGTVSTVAVEFITHPIDSINMTSKVISTGSS